MQEDGSTVFGHGPSSFFLSCGCTDSLCMGCRTLPARQNLAVFRSFSRLYYEALVKVDTEG